MTETAVQHRNQQAREVLRLVNALIGEIERAMLAISQNQLFELEESLAEQESLTDRLRLIGDQRPETGDRDDRIGRPALDRGLAKELSDANRALQKLNRIYARMLEHSCHSAALMASLLGSSRGHFQEASGSRLRCQTWSCQM